MDLQIIYIAALCVIVILAALWKIYRNIEEVFIASGDYIGENIQALNNSISGRLNVLQNENKILREDVSRKLDALAKTITAANNNAELGLNSMVKEW